MTSKKKRWKPNKEKMSSTIQKKNNILQNFENGKTALKWFYFPQNFEKLKEILSNYLSSKIKNSYFCT